MSFGGRLRAGSGWSIAAFVAVGGLFACGRSLIDRVPEEPLDAGDEQGSSGGGSGTQPGSGTTANGSSGEGSSNGGSSSDVTSEGSTGSSSGTSVGPTGGSSEGSSSSSGGSSTKDAGPAYSCYSSDYTYTCSWNGTPISLTHLCNSTMEGMPDESLVGTCNGFETDDPSQSCLNGEAINTFVAPQEFPGVYLVHNGLMGNQCTYGLWTFTQ